jgi:hypothetical protein
MRTLILIVLLSWGLYTGAQTPEASLEKAQRATFRIDASECMKNDSRSGTGFLWSDGKTVVTALHVVAGCRKVSVYSEILKKGFPATLVHCLNGADLAMLQMAAPIGDAQPLPVSTQKPVVHDELTVLGYAMLINRMDSTELKVKFGGPHLEDIVSPEVLKDLEIRESPSLKLDITSVEGFLAPGLSGAPIMDKAGRVVSIGDGGLNGGTVGIAWGVPATNLAALKDSGEKPSAKAGDPSLFAAETAVHPTGPAISCGAGSFVKMRTMQYSEILRSTDDAAGLAKVLTFFAILGIDPSDLSYDIYQDGSSGAAIAVPEGKTLQSGTVGCRVDVLQNLAMFIQMAPLSSPAEMYPVSLAFERNFAPMPQWQPDPDFTYVQARHRADGLTVDRKVLLHTVRNPYSGQFSWDQGAVYETLAVKGNWFVGTVAMDRVYRLATAQFAQLCTRQPGANGCDQLRQQMRVMVQAVIAAHLTTFPNN